LLATARRRADDINCFTGISDGPRPASYALIREETHTSSRKSPIYLRFYQAWVCVPTFLWNSPTQIILYYDQQMHNYFTNYHTPTCFDTIVSYFGSM